MPHFYRQGSIAFGSLLLLLLLRLPIHAEQIALKLVDGRPCARVAIRHGKQSIEANVVLDLGVQVPIVLHSKTGKLLGVEPGDSVTLRFDGVPQDAFADVPVSMAEIPMLDTLTREHATELGEVPAVAVLGLPVFSALVPQLDLAGSRLVLLSTEEAAETVKSATLAVPLEVSQGRLFFDALGPDAKERRIRFRTSRYDTLIDAKIAASIGKDKDKDKVSQDAKATDGTRLDLSKFVAFRPSDFYEEIQPRPGIVLGTNLLKFFRVTIDLDRKQFLWEQVRQPEFPAEERDYFAAAISQDADRVETFLQQHPDSRLAQEAGGKLLEFRLAERPADTEALLHAIRARASSTPKQRRATTLLTLADGWMTGDREDRFTLATNALELALEGARDDLDATVAYRLQARLGRIAYVRGDLRTARRRLLAAAFGLPRDPQVNLWLGELYEAMKKPVRAWSRYLQATLAEETPLEAYRGLGRLNCDPALRSRFSMRDASELLEGRIETFHPRRHYVQEKTRYPKHVALVELFTNIDNAEKTHAASAALDALGEYFDLDEAETAKEPVALLEYHVKAAKPDPLTVPFSRARAAFYRVADVPMAIFDGTRSSCEGGTAMAILPTYGSYLDLARSNKAADPTAKPPVSFSAKIHQEGHRCIGTVTLNAEVEADTLADAVLHVVVCESVVMVPGGNGRVLHRHVVRDSLTPAGGLPLASELGTGKARFTFEVDLDIEALRKRLTGHMDQLEKSGGVSLLMKPDYVDASEVVLVAFVQDAATRAILGVATVRPRVEKKPDRDKEAVR